VPKAWVLMPVLFLVSLKSLAIEPILDQQATLYFNMSFDAGYKKTLVSNYGLRFDRGLIQSDSVMTISQLIAKPAIFDLQLNKYGIKAIELNGINYTDDNYIYNATEADTEVVTENTKETIDEPKKKTKGLTHYINKAPTGVLIGIIIGVVALVDSTSSGK